MLRYKVAYYIDIVAIALSVLFLGGFSLAMKDISEKVFVKELYPTMSFINKVSPNVAYKSILKMSMIWGLTAFVVLILGTLACFLLKSKHRLGSIPFNILAFFVLLVGTSFVAFPLAFFFFTCTLITLTVTPEMRSYEAKRKINKKNNKENGKK